MTERELEQTSKKQKHSLKAEERTKSRNILLQIIDFMCKGIQTAKYLQNIKIGMYK